MKKNYEEILAILEEKIDSVSSFAYQDYYEKDLELGPIKEVHHEGGEDEGTHWESVQYFEDHDVYISVTGYYTSYDGTDFDGGWSCCQEVRPIEKIVTFYEPKK